MAERKAFRALEDLTLPAYFPGAMPARFNDLIDEFNHAGRSAGLASSAQIDSAGQPPVLDLNGADPDTSVSLAYVEGQALTAIAPAATVDDPDAVDFDGGSLTVEFSANGSDYDRISIIDQGMGVGQISLSEIEVYYNFGHLDAEQNPIGPELIGTYSGGWDGVSPLVIQLNGTADLEAVQALTRAIGFFNMTLRTSGEDRMLTFTLVDGDGNSAAPAVATIDVTVTNDPAIAQDDSFFTFENSMIAAGNIFANNSYGDDIDWDGDPFEVVEVEVNGSPVDLGQQIILASGALLTVRADGTFDYDPNGQFNDLAQAGSGAVNSQATESFTYKITGGDTATVTIFVNGVASPGDKMKGDDGDNMIIGTPLDDFFQVDQLGSEILYGLGANDGFYFGAFLDPSDFIDGGDGANDQLILQGNVAITILPTHVRNVELLSLVSGSEARFGDLAGNDYDYDITMDDDAVGAGERFKIWFNGLLAGEDVIFDGSEESDGHFTLYAGLGTDHLIGGGGNDLFYFGEGAFAFGDRLEGNGGLDQLALRGDYASSPIVLEVDSLVDIETIVLISAFDRTYGPAGGHFAYDITTDDGNVAAGATLSVWGINLAPTESIFFDGSGETDGRFDIYSGACSDVLVGGGGGDMIWGNLGSDLMAGGDGNDRFVYRSTADSAGRSSDEIMDFTVGDLIDLAAIDADPILRGNQAFTFVDGPFTAAGQVRAEDLGGGAWAIYVNTDSDIGTAEMIIGVTVTDSDPITATDFIL